MERGERSQPGPPPPPPPQFPHLQAPRPRFTPIPVPLSWAEGPLPADEAPGPGAVPGGPPPPLLMCHRAEQPGGQRSGRQCGPGAGEGPCVCVAVCPAPPPRPPQPPRILHPSGVGGAPARLGRCRGAAGLPHGGGDRRWPEWVPRAEGDPFFWGGCPPPPPRGQPWLRSGRSWPKSPPHTPPVLSGPSYVFPAHPLHKRARRCHASAPPPPR